MGWFRRADRIPSPPYHLLDFERAAGEYAGRYRSARNPHRTPVADAILHAIANLSYRMQVDPHSSSTAIGAKWYMREYGELNWHWPSPAYVEVATRYEEPLLAALARFEAQYGEVVPDSFDTLLRLANVPPWRILYGPVLPPTIGLFARLLNELRDRTRDLQEALDYQTATSDVLKVISQSVADLDSVLSAMVSSAVTLCRAEQAVIFRSHGSEYRWAAGHGLLPEYDRIESDTIIRPGLGSLIGRVALEGRTVTIPMPGPTRCTRLRRRRAPAMCARCSACRCCAMAS
jgi:hypothetical protein